MPDASDIVSQIATSAVEDVQSAAADGRTATKVPIPDQIAAAKFTAAQDALAGTNASGGPVSGWGRLRAARPILPGGGPC